jgi:hypothetical protein
MKSRFFVPVTILTASCSGNDLEKFVESAAEIICSCLPEDDRPNCEEHVEAELSTSMLGECPYNSENFNECLYALEQRAEVVEGDEDCLSYVAPSGYRIQDLCPQVCVPPDSEADNACNSCAE